MAVVYETNRYGDKVAVAVDGPGGCVSAENKSPMPKWMQKIFDDMGAFDPTEKT